jgi:hypothetical protein
VQRFPWPLRHTLRGRWIVILFAPADGIYINGLLADKCGELLTAFFRQRR